MKRPKVEGLLDADDLAFLGSSNVTSPAISECQNNDQVSNDSSNEALVVDMERSGSNTPGRLHYVLISHNILPFLQQVITPLH